MEKHRILQLVFAFLLAGLGSLTIFAFANTAQAAQYQHIPTSENLVTGTESNITSATAAAAGGTNVGSWKGTLADDNFHWTVTGTGAGVNAQLNMDGVELYGANKIEVQTEVDVDAAIALKVQICDWDDASAAGNFDAVEDAQCNDGDVDSDGAGWRSLNSQNATNADIGLTTIATPVSLRWHIYDGYFTTGSTGGTALSTPLANFISPDSNKRIKIRYFSATASAVIDIDYLRAQVMIDSIYQPAGFTNLGSGGTIAGTYVNASAIGNTTGAQVAGGDDIRLTVPGTATASQFYFSYKNVKTYTGMNTILVRTEYGCAAVGVNITPRIYNFNTTSWENLTGATIACNATDAADVWAKNNITIEHYLSTGASGGEIRVGWLASAAHATAFPRVDYMYIMVGTTNSDSSKCEIPIGTGTATDCTNTRAIDTEANAGGVNMDITSEDESTNMGTGEANSYYPFDIDNDATATEEGAAAHIAFAVTVPTNAQVIGNLFAANFAGRSAGTTATVALGLKDYSGYNTSATGSWLAVGATSAASAQVYTDVVTTTSATVNGQQINPEDYVHTGLNEMRLRLRTSADSAAADNNVVNWDFAMVSLRWIEPPSNPSRTYQHIPTSENLVTGTESNITSATAAAAGGTNVGSWKGTLADDNFHWTVTGTGAGVNAQLNMDGVELYGANKIEVQTEVDVDAAIALKVQICDWDDASAAGNFDAVEDAQCNDGDVDSDGAGWRSLNSQNATNADIGLTTIATPVSLRWHIYDGYFTTGSTGGTALSTPLANFISPDSNKRIKIRYFSATASAVIDIDYLRAQVMIDSIYQPAGFTNLGSGGTIAGTYVNASAIGNTTGAQVAGGDDIRLTVPGTATASQFYFSYKNVKTYTGMNTILVRTEYGCAAVGVNITPRIYNFNTTSWENLTGATIACNATDAADVWAKNNITIEHYLSTGASGGEIRVGWLASAAHATAFPRVDYMYIMVGTTNSDSSKCEIPIGTGTATDCTNTRAIDTEANAGGVNMDITSEDESTNMGTGEANSYYPFDIDNDATATEEGAAAHIAFAVTVPTNAQVTGNLFAANVKGRTTGSPTLALGLKDYSGYNTSATGSWLAVGSTFTTTAQVYTDVVTTTSATVNGQQINPEDYVHTGLNEMRLRLRYTADGAVADNNIANWDFAMVSLRWIEISTGITVSGSVYQINDSSVLTSFNGSMKLVVGASTNYTTTAASGVFSFASVTTPSSGAIMTIFLDTDNAAPQGATIVKYGSSCTGTPNCTGLHVTTGTLILDSKDGTVFANSDLAGCDSDSAGSTCHSDTDIDFNVNTGILTNLYQTLKIATGTTFTPGNTVFAGTIEIDGILNGTNAVNISVNNDWINDGTYTANGGELVVNPQNATPTVIGGSADTTFGKLTIVSGERVVQFKAGNTISVTGLLTLNGTPQQPLEIKSTIPGQQWLINYTGTNSMNFTIVRDGGCAGGNLLNPNITMLNGGNNSVACWNFIPKGGNGGSVGEGGGAGGGAGDCTQATATAVRTGNIVTSITVNSGGSCYNFPPNVSLVGGAGGGAIAQAVVSGGAVTTINVLQGGNGYTSDPTVIITGGQGGQGGGGGAGEGGGAGGGAGQGGGGAGGGGGESP
jgi:hypothetical protein